MNILVTANKVPFNPGGADYHINGLANALKQHGYDTDLIRLPFTASPYACVDELMAFCASQNYTRFNNTEIDRLISLQFPGYGIQHPDHRIWVMHQHREVYELYSKQPQGNALSNLKAAVERFDNQAFATAKKLFANSQNVAARMQKYNGMTAKPLYHPPAGADQFYSDEEWGYIFYPSRLETLKRQSLLIQAAQFVKAPVKIIIGGTGPQARHYQAEIEQLQLTDRVRLIGRFSESEKYSLYAHALAVFFGPYDEDYGYITLESMLSGKPVITCTDSGGPLEFITQGETGLICEPEPEQLAAAIDQLWTNKARTRTMGMNAHEAYHQLGISWSTVVQALLTD